ncbi:SDA1-domain-containing protein [Peziza echinospora]|nr:SDA1-domain-containing protein [Peziza echinospora]
MVKRKRAALVKLTNLPMLQNLIRRDPPSYEDEFLLQYRHYESQRDIFMTTASATDTDNTVADKFSELVGFMAQVANCYPTHTKNFPNDLAQLLLQNHASFHPDLREKLVQSLVLLRNKDVITSSELLKVLFPILTVTKAKALRGQIYTTIISEMRNANAKAKNHRLNKTVQTVLFNLVESGKDDPTSTVGSWAVKLTRELWKRAVWDDARTVEIMKEAALSRNQKVMVGGVRFFLGVDQEREEALEGGDSDDENIREVVTNLRKGAGISKTAKKKRTLDKAIQTMKRKEKSKNKAHPLNFSALHLLHDPQGFAEKLYSLHLSRNNTKLALENKLAVLQLITRLVGLHKLELLQIYSYMLKYLTPRQREVTHFLACAAQASHDLVPPDVLEPLVKKIADEFVSEGVASEIATAGLNAIREICARAPLAMTTTLLQDLTEYKGSNDRGVMMASRSLIALYREIAPEMLKRKDRGKTASMGMKTSTGGLRFGESRTGVIEGLDLLEEWKEKQKLAKAEEEGVDVDDLSDDDEANWDGWDVEDDDDSDNEGWTNVEDDKDIVISDSEDENTPAKPKSATDSADPEAAPVKKKRKLTRTERAKAALLDDDDLTNKDPASLTEAQIAMKMEEMRINNLATTRILTPADFAKLAELRTEAALSKLTGKAENAPKVNPNAATFHHATINEEPLLAGTIARGYKSVKATREERIEKAREGREDEGKHGSKKGKLLALKAHSTTNREKARKKNFLMTLGMAKRKQKMKLVDRGKVLKAHAEKQRKGK